MIAAAATAAAEPFNTSRRVTGVLFARLIDHLERGGAYSVAVSFKNVAPESVAAGDRLIRAKGLNPLPYVDAARYYGEPYTRELEQALFDKISAAVADSVPLDVVRLRPFEPEDTDIPVIQIDYQLRPVSLYEVTPAAVVWINWYVPPAPVLRKIL